jgi:hypothetical protein
MRGYAYYDFSPSPTQYETREDYEDAVASFAEDLMEAEAYEAEETVIA